MNKWLNTDRNVSVQEKESDREWSGSERRSIGRRPFLGSLATLGIAGGTFGGVAGAQSGWPDGGDPYYTSLVRDFREINGLTPGQFVYGNTEAAALDAYQVQGSAGESTEIDVGYELPFTTATRVITSQGVENPWGVTMRGIVEDRDVSDGDVLLGVVYLRAHENSANTPTVRYTAKSSANESSNMVSGKNEVSPTTEWQRYYFPMEFEYDASAGDWWTELFLGFGEQSVEIGGMAVMDFGGGVSVDTLPSGVVEDSGSNTDWEEAADGRIENHRKDELEVTVTDVNGDPVEGAGVTVSMQEHEFGWGVAVDAQHLINGTEEGDRYREEIDRLFNTGVLANQHKWRFWENDRQLADDATDWLIDQGMDVRGHTCLWSAIDSWAVPNDVVRAMGKTWEEQNINDPDLDADHVRERTFEHVEEIISHYGDKIDEWEVVNEVTNEQGFVEAINGGSFDGVDPLQAPVLAEWYQTARDVAPEGTTLALNEYNTLVGPYGGTRDDYETSIEFLAGQDAGLDAAGLQGHFSQSETLRSGDLMDVYDRYAEHDVGLRITEFEMADETWDEDDKGEFFYEFLKTTFSHPAVDDFVAWGLIDTIHWKSDAPFFDEDWNAKAPLEHYEDLVLDEWWTSDAGGTDDEGRYTIEGFKGEYEVRVSSGDQTTTEEVTLSDGGASIEISLDVEQDTPTASPTATETDTPTDAEGPGLGVLSALAGVAGLSGYALSRPDDDE